ncbi:hypothetical protein [Caldimonas sp.]|uniref:hypothetical protein n=1 Tax=Caldimonas sp. TaxID=2838790 RepID=UPI003918C9F0
MFAQGSTVRQAAMTPREVASLKGLGRALKPAAVSQRYILCPSCDQHSGEVRADPRSGRICCCPDCGPVTVDGSDLAAWKLDEDWFQRSLRRALDIQSHDGVVALADGIWRLGDARQSPVVLARDLTRLWHEPSVLGRVRSAKAATRVIAPMCVQVRGNPFDDGAGVEWMPLEERFMLLGDGISYIDSGDRAAMFRAVDPSVPVHGPFSEDFRWVTLKGWSHGPIQLSEGQSAVLRVLWGLSGAKIMRERLKDKAGIESNPSDIFKLKTHEKGRPEHEGPKFAYKALVDVTKGGEYSMPRDKALSLVL